MVDVYGRLHEGSIALTIGRLQRCSFVLVCSFFVQVLRIISRLVYQLSLSLHQLSAEESKCAAMEAFELICL